MVALRLWLGVALLHVVYVLYVQQLRDVEQRLSNAYKLIEELNEKLRHSGESSGRGSIAQLLQVKRLHIVMAANT